VALLTVVPILTMASAVIGIFGGAIIGKLMLDVSFFAFFAEMQRAADGWDVAIGLLKSVAYAAAIVFVSCQQGFATSGGAAGVGRRTTSTVVITLFLLVLLNTISTAMFAIFDE
jgi:phospholipid/cholesterol/gamma-HCH transport system permease protein